MTIPVMTAIADPRREAELAAGVDGGSELTLVRRCVDIADLLAAAAAGLAQAVVVSEDLRMLDAAAVRRLTDVGVGVVGLVPGGDASAEHRLRQLGVGQIVAAPVDPQLLGEAVSRAVGGLDRDHSLDRILDWSAAPYPPRAAAAPIAAAGPDPLPQLEPGRVIAVWGPAGAPGRTTVAVNLAAELADLGAEVIAVDADSYGGTVAHLLGVLDEAAGLAAACRHANHGMLDAASFAGLALSVRPRLRLLTGITRADRWPELRPSALTTVLARARTQAAFVVVDCGFCLEQDEELAYDTEAPRRNGATLAVLDAAEVTIGVAAGDPVGLARYLRARSELTEARSSGELITVVNRVRRGAIGPGDPQPEIAAALERYAGITTAVMVPDDPAATDAALAEGRLLCEVAPKSAVRHAIRGLAARLIDAPAASRRGILTALRGTR